MRLSELNYLGAARATAAGGGGTGDGKATGGGKKPPGGGGSKPPSKPPKTDTGRKGPSRMDTVAARERAAAEAKRRAAEAEAERKRRKLLEDKKRGGTTGGKDVTRPADPNMGSDGKCNPSYVLIDGKCRFLADGIPPEPPKQNDTPPVVGPDGINTTKETPNQPPPLKAETVPGTSSGGGGGGPGPAALVEQDPVVGIGPVVSPDINQVMKQSGTGSTSSQYVKYGLWVLGAGAIGFAIYKFRRKA